MLGKQFKAQPFSNDIAWAINYPTRTTCFVAWVNEIMNVRKKGKKNTWSRQHNKNTYKFYP